VLTIIDTKSFTKVGEVAGHREIPTRAWFIDRAGKKLYLNLTGTDEVGVIDLSTRQLVERWPLPDVQVAHAIALDER